MSSVYHQRLALAAARDQLLVNGYKPLPAKGKRVLIKGWTTAEIDTHWVRAHIGFPNTGIRCDGLCAVDIDCDSGGLASEIRGVVESVLGPTRCVRTRGLRMILLYASDSGGSACTPKYRDGAGNTNRIEVLRGNKRQFLAFGMHPSGQPYEWPDESPATVPADQLPRVTEEQVEVMLERVREYLDGCDYLEQLQGEPDVGGYVVEQKLTPEMQFTIVGPPGFEGVLSTTEMIDVLESMGGDATLQCNLDGVRANSDSRAGLARLVGDKLYISDFVKERIYTLPPAQVGLGEALAEADLLTPQDLAQAFPAATGPVLGRRFFCEATGKGHDPDRPEIGYDVQATKRAFGSAAFDAWMGSCRRAVDFCFNPGEDRWVRETTGDYFNTYRQARHPTTGGETDTWEEFLEHLLPVLAEREWFEQWLAYKAQNPAQKCHGVLMVAHRTFGTGRGTLFEIIRKAFGAHNTRTVDFHSVTGKSGQAQFNDWMSSSLFVLVPEVKETDPYAARSHNVKEQAYEALKEVADPTAGSIRIKEKFGRIREERCYTSLLAATNHDDALALPADDRRLAILSNGKPMEPLFAARVHAWLNDPRNIGALWRRLVTTETSYVPSGEPIYTPAKRRMTEASASDVEVVLAGVRRLCAGDWVSYTRAVELAHEVALLENMDLSGGAMAYLKRLIKREFPRRASRVRMDGGGQVYAHHVRGSLTLDADGVRAEMLKSEGPLKEDGE